MEKSNFELSDIIGDIYRRICHASMRAGREPDEVELIAVTKTQNDNVIDNAIIHGLRNFGENYVQEAIKKHTSLNQTCEYTKINWHLIGHLQKNKVKPAIKHFSVIHTIDSLELAYLIDKEAKKIGKVQNGLIQVKLSDEPTKHGINSKELPSLVEKILVLENLQIQGLMGIPEFFADPEKVRPYYSKLRYLQEQLISSGYNQLKELSMGMSNDFEIAIEEGATIVRIGTAIFGKRKPRN